MNDVLHEYKNFMNLNFHGLEVRKPLFYSWKKGLRFDLQIEEDDTNKYFQEVQKRVFTLFESAFEPNDQLFFVLMDYKWKKHRIRINNYAFKQFTNLYKKQIGYNKLSQRYSFESPSDKWNQVIIQTSVKNVNYKNILTAIGHTDFPSRQPNLNHKTRSGEEIYFININKALILNMYDDRGLDIIASKTETLTPIYKKFNEWILDYDRKQIDEQMML